MTDEQASDRSNDPTDNEIVNNDGTLAEKAAYDIRVAAMSKERADAIANGTYGKPRYANGRKAVLGAIDVLLSRTRNIQKIYDAMQERLDVDPVGFVQQIALPLMPKSMIEGREDLDTSKDGMGTVVVIPDNGRSPDAIDPADPDGGK